MNTRLPLPKIVPRNLNGFCCCDHREFLIEWESQMKSAEVVACGFYDEETEKFFQTRSRTTKWLDPDQGDNCSSTISYTIDGEQLILLLESGLPTEEACELPSEEFTQGPCEPRFSVIESNEPWQYSGESLTFSDIAAGAKSKGNAAPFAFPSVGQSSVWIDFGEAGEAVYETGRVRPFVQFDVVTAEEFWTSGTVEIGVGFAFWLREQGDADESNWSRMASHVAVLKHEGFPSRIWRADDWVDFPAVPATGKEVFVRAGSVRVGG